MRRAAGPEVDRGEKRALLKIEHAKQVLRVGISAVDAVPENRNIGAAGFRHHQQLVHGLFEAVENHFGLVSDRVQEQHLAALLVDRDQSARAGHFLAPLPNDARLIAQAR